MTAIRDEESYKKRTQVGRNPYPILYRGLILIAITFIISGFLLPELLPDVKGETLSQLNSLLTVLLGVFIGAIIYMVIYDYVNLRNQIRNWRHEYANRRVEEIYAPLWRESHGLLSEIEGYRDVRTWLFNAKFGDPANPTYTGFKNISESHLGLFIDSKARKLLNDFHIAVEKYGESINTAWQDLYKYAADRVTEISKGGEGTASGPHTAMFEAFRGNPIIVYNPDNNKIVEDAKKNFIDDHEKISHSIEQARTDFDDILEKLRKLPSMKRLREERGKCLPKGRDVLTRLKEIIEDPISVVLDFEGSDYKS